MFGLVQLVSCDDYFVAHTSYLGGCDQSPLSRDARDVNGFRDA